ncbi:hypothetical protein NOVO_06795 [Rickettsiales bacterium Ac37b]|nr:hypothetical protein NOVO_06795 [Rickettsiales bacterium Ac37b]
MKKISAVFIIVLCTIHPSIGFSLVNAQVPNSSLIAEPSMGWIIPMNWNLIYYPKSSIYNTTSNQSSTSIPKFNSKYAILGIVSGLAQNALFEGQNSQGLGFSANFLPGFTECQTVTKDDKLYISILEFGKFILSSFANVLDVMDNLPQFKLWAEEQSNLLIPPRLHFLITDKTGEVIIIELINGQMKVFNKYDEFLTTKLFIPISTCYYPN